MVFSCRQAGTLQGMVISDCKGTDHSAKFVLRCDADRFFAAQARRAAGYPSLGGFRVVLTKLALTRRHTRGRFLVALQVALEIRQVPFGPG